jgi:hypothetical protein
VLTDDDLVLLTRRIVHKLTALIPDLVLVAPHLGSSNPGVSCRIGTSRRQSMSNPSVGYEARRQSAKRLEPSVRLVTGTPYGLAPAGAGVGVGPSDGAR